MCESHETEAIMAKLNEIDEKLNRSHSIIELVASQVKPVLDQLSSGPIGKMLGMKKVLP